MEIRQLSDALLNAGDFRRRLIFKELDIKRGNNGIELPAKGGILSYFKGEKYPWKGIMNKEPILRGPIDALDSVKAAIRAAMGIATSKPIRYLMPLLLLGPWRNKIIRSFLEGFYQICQDALYGYYLKPELFCPVVREIYNEGIKFIKKETIWWDLLMCPCMFLESDDTYRLVFQDAFGEINKEALLKNPRKELDRIFGILLSRETRESQKDKYRKIRLLFKWGSLLFRKELRKLAEAMAEIDYSKIKLDDGDNYHALTRVYYNFSNKPFVERINERKSIDEAWRNLIIK